MQHTRYFIRPATSNELPLLRELDDAAGVLYERAGTTLNLPPDNEFVVSESVRWQRCLEAGTTLIACDRDGAAVGFAAVGRLDEAPYLDQLSVRPAHMRAGLGTALLQAATRLVDDGRSQAFWLTTYDHFAWNRPFYEKNGFVQVPEPAQRIAMRRQLLNADSRTTG